MSKIALEAKALCQGYGQKHAPGYTAQRMETLDILENASLVLKAGEMVALVAPSGTGKSTLLHCLGLLEQPQAGNIMISGQETSHMTDPQRTYVRRHHIGFVFQHHGLLSEFSALENVTMPLRLAGKSANKAAQKAERLLDGIGLKDRQQHRPAELSGGEQQRVAIARALANSPTVLLADEPTGNLDPKTGGEVFSLLLDQCRQHDCAVLAATHNIAMAGRMDRSVTLKDKRVVNLDLSS